MSAQTLIHVLLIIVRREDAGIDTHDLDNVPCNFCFLLSDMKLISFCDFSVHAFNREAFNYYDQGDEFNL